MNKVKESKRHHWWPQGLSKHWMNDDGFLYQIFCDDRVIEQTNTNKFGVRGHAHTVDFHTDPNIWYENFESIFQPTDDSFPKIVQWLESFQIHTLNQHCGFGARLQPLNADWKKLNQLSICLISLIVRSPQFRNQIKITAEHYQEGWNPPTGNSNLIKFSMRNDLEFFSKRCANLGKFAILASGSSEFIFGDGLLHTFISRDINPHNQMMLVPVTPKICILYANPRSYKTYPPLMGLHLNENEVKKIGRAHV